jgi:hypothetical protein
MSNNLNLEKKFNLKTIIYLDADDTFFPTSWCNKNMINLNSQESINEYKLYFIELDKTVSDFLLHLKKYAQIFIVTNANIKWIKSFLNVLTTTRKVIMENNIRIVSARDIYSKTLSSPTEWKINTFRDILSNITNTLPTDSDCNTILNIISIGDAQYEYIALLNLDNYFKSNNNKINYLLKSIKFVEKPNFDLIIDQMQIVQKNMDYIVNKIGYLDLKFKD